MGKPYKRKTLHGVCSELISAMSSLNMLPSSIKNTKEGAYLSETDEYAKHSMSHIEMAFDSLISIMEANK